jgi:hypothetical protein
MIKRSVATTLLASGLVALLSSCAGSQTSGLEPCSGPVGNGIGPTTLPQEHELEYVGSALWTRAFDGEVRGGCLYVSFLNGLGIFDVSDEDEPRMVSKLFLGGGFGIEVEGQTAFIAAGPKGLQIVDVSNPLYPSVVGTAGSAGSMKDVVVREGMAYAADGASGLAVFDVSDPGSPSLVSVFETPGSAEGVVLKENLAVLADGPSGIQVVDVSDPASPVSVGSLETGDVAEEVALSGDYAYVANASSGLQIIDLSDPSSPRLHVSFPTSGYAKGLTVQGDKVLVGNLYDASLQVIDVSEPAAPVELADFRYRFPNEPWDVVVEGERAYILDYFAGILITDISDPSEPRAVGAYETPQFLAGLDIDADRAVTLGQEMYGFAVLDLSEPAEPELLGRSNAMMLRFPKFMVAQGDYGYIAYGGLSMVNLTEVNLRDTTTPRVFSQVMPPGAASCVRVRGDYAYVTSDFGGFSVVDLSDVEAPTIAGTTELTGFSFGMALKDHHAFIGNRNTLKVVDVTDPSEPTVVASMETPEDVNDVKIRGDYAYLADGVSGFYVVNIADPLNPAISGSLDLGGFINSVALTGDFAFVTDEDFGVRKIDVSNPASPVLVASFDTPGEPTDVAVYGDYVVVNDAFSILVLR